MIITRVAVVKKFFEPVSSSEFMAFWKACSEDERQEFAVSAATQLGETLDSK